MKKIFLVLLLFLYSNFIDAQNIWTLHECPAGIPNTIYFDKKTNNLYAGTDERTFRFISCDVDGMIYGLSTRYG